MAFHLRNDGISYQLMKATKYKPLMEAHKNKKKNFPKQVATEIKIFRADVQWLNCNTNPDITMDGQLDGVSNYYNRHSPDGITNVRSFEGVWYRNIYPATDLHYYSTEAGLKYDFIVHAGGNYKSIQMEIKGCEGISLKKDGSVLLKTPFGDIAEEAPIVYQNGKKLSSAWILTGNILSFDIQGYDNTKDLIIDPITRLWGTYYGGSNTDFGLAVATDANNNVIIAGGTEGATGTVIATAGSHMQTFGGGGIDAFVAKFNSAGVRQWATYYGDAGDELGEGCATAANGDIVMTGFTDGVSGPAMSTSGSYQTTFGGGFVDAFVVKFNSSGTRLWGTYFGGGGDDDAPTCTVDNSGDVIIGGYTDSNTGISSSGAHQTTFAGGIYDGFVAKFNSAGATQWRTYYGGSGYDDVTGIDANSTGEIFIVGTTESTALGDIATTSAFQTTFGGVADGFAVKFNAAGVRQWGTYFGGSGYDGLFSASADALGNVYAAGDTESSSAISSTGAHQVTYGGMGDACLVKFDGTGARQWSTYYGGADYDESYSCSTDPGGNIYLAGSTETFAGNSISTSPSFQSTFGGSTDAYLAKFSSTGVRLWGTYYGGAGDEAGYCACDPAGDVYLAGATDSSTGTVIASSGSHQPAFGGMADAFLAKFGGCVAPAPATIVTTTLSGCSNQTITLIANAVATAWFTTPTGGAPVATSNTFVIGTLAAGTYTYYAASYDCTVNPNRTPVTLTIAASPTIIAQSVTSVICIGQTGTLTATGAPNFTWTGLGIGSTMTVSPNVTTVYTVSAGMPGCTSTETVTQVVSNCVSIHAIEQDGINNVYPNPTDGIVFLSVNKLSTVRIVDVVGREVLSTSLLPGENKITLPEKSGVYFVHCEGKTFKIIKQ